MLTPSPEIIQLLATFAVAMTAPTFAKALVFIYTVILTPGQRTIAAALRVQGLHWQVGTSQRTHVVGNGWRRRVWPNYSLANQRYTPIAYELVASFFERGNAGHLSIVQGEHGRPWRCRQRTT